MIHRTRRRARVESVIFRDVWWLVKMEAVYMLGCANVPYTNEANARRHIFKLAQADPRREGERLLKAFPRRQIL